MYKKSMVLLMLLGVANFALSRILAEVAGKKIDSRQLDAQVQLVLKSAQGKLQDSSALREQVLQRMVTREIVTREAQRLHLDKKSLYINGLKQAEKELQPSDLANYKPVLLADAYFADFAQKHPITKAEAKKLYAHEVAFYKGSQAVKVGEILTNNLSDSNRALAELKQGKAFSSVAARYTVDPHLKSSAGIYPSYINLKDLQVADPNYAQLIEKLEPGQYTPHPIQVANHQYLIIKLIDKKPVAIPAFARVEKELKLNLLQQKLQEESQRLAKHYQVKLYPH
jgi:probable signal peptide protein